MARRGRCNIKKECKRGRAGLLHSRPAWCGAGHCAGVKAGVLEYRCCMHDTIAAKRWACRRGCVQARKSRTGTTERPSGHASTTRLPCNYARLLVRVCVCACVRVCVCVRACVYVCVFHEASSWCPLADEGVVNGGGCVRVIRILCKHTMQVHTQPCNVPCLHLNLRALLCLLLPPNSCAWLIFVHPCPDGCASPACCFTHPSALYLRPNPLSQPIPHCLRLLPVLPLLISIQHTPLVV